MLQWQHKHEKDLPRWRKLVEEGDDAPPDFYEQPEILPGSSFYWRAFSDLSSDRAVGMGIGPIPFSSILRYARLNRIGDIDEFDRLRQTISEVDAVFLSLNAPKDKTDGKTRSLVPVADIEGVGRLLDRMGK